MDNEKPGRYEILSTLYKTITNAAPAERGVRLDLSNREHADLALALGMALQFEGAQRMNPAGTLRHSPRTEVQSPKLRRLQKLAALRNSLAARQRGLENLKRNVSQMEAALVEEQERWEAERKRLEG